MAQNNNNSSAFSYLCCGLDQASPLGGIFPGGTKENGYIKEMEQVQDWNNPFDVVRNDQYRGIDREYSVESREDIDHKSPDFRSPDYRYPASPRSQGYGYASRKVVGSGPDSHSTGTGYRRRTYQTSMQGFNPTESEYSSHKKFIHRPHTTKALTMHEEIFISGSMSHDSSSSMNSHKLNKKLLASRNSKNLLHQIMLSKKTETTRGKIITPEDVRDPETVPGMKCQEDVDEEEDAQRRALTMLMSDLYRFNPKAGYACFSVMEIQARSRNKYTLLNPFV